MILNSEGRSANRTGRDLMHRREKLGKSFAAARRGRDHRHPQLMGEPIRIRLWLISAGPSCAHGLKMAAIRMPSVIPDPGSARDSVFVMSL